MDLLPSIFRRASVVGSGSSPRIWGTWALYLSGARGSGLAVGGDGRLRGPRARELVCMSLRPAACLCALPHASRAPGRCCHDGPRPRKRRQRTAGNPIGRGQRRRRGGRGWRHRPLPRRTSLAALPSASARLRAGARGRHTAPGRTHSSYPVPWRARHGLSPFRGGYPTPALEQGSYLDVGYKVLNLAWPAARIGRSRWLDGLPAVCVPSRGDAQSGWTWAEQAKRAVRIPSAVRCGRGSNGTAPRPHPCGRCRD